MAREIVPALLVLQDGSVYSGKSCGIVGTVTGELAFNTAMTGYQEVFTDPSYFGQILLMAAPHIGNYGVHTNEVESDSCKIAGIVVRKFSEVVSRYGESASLQQFLERDRKVGICDVDTRAVVRHIRQAGAMNCIISSEYQDIEFLKEELAKAPGMSGRELSSLVSCKQAYFVGNSEAAIKIAVLDLGVKRSILHCLTERGAYLKVFPMDSSVQDILEWKPDGIVFSNGPGDPSAMTETIQLIGKLMESNLLCFGICLGHQLIGLSQGLRTIKMFNGHRGINHPVKNLMTGKCEITSQNHGFVISEESVRENPDIEVTHVHLNDNTIAGIRLKHKNVFGVQYHPEASAGPHDSRYLFDEFVSDVYRSKGSSVVSPG